MKTPSTKTAIGIVIGLFIIIFIGSFAFSFVKNRVPGQSGDSINDKLTKEEIEIMSLASAAKTKEEGVSICKKNYINQCFAIVALNFEDKNVCRGAPSQSICNSQLEQLKKDFGGLKDDGDTGDVTNPGDDDSDKEFVNKCQKGVALQTGSGKMTITGKETFTIEGVKYEACCMEAITYDNGEGGEDSSKLCTPVDQPVDSFIALKKINGRYVLNMTSLIINGETCNIDYNENGIQEYKSCF